MLHEPIYNNSLTDAAEEAFRIRDKAALKQQMLDLSAELQSTSDFYAVAAKLMVTTALYDSLHGGYASMFVCDYVNF